MNDQDLYEAELARLMKSSPYNKIKDADLRRTAVKLVLMIPSECTLDSVKYQSIIQTLFTSPQIGEVIKSLRKRSEASIEKRLAEFKNKGKNTPKLLIKHYLNFESYLDEIVLHIYLAEHDSSFSNVATVKERNKFSSEFQKLASRMAAMLDQISDLDGQFPDEVSSVLDAYDKVVFAHNKAIWDKDCLQRNPSYTFSDQLSEEQEIFYYSGAQDFEARLLKHAEGITIWAKTKPVALRIGNPDVARLRLVRILTSHFRFKFGTPLRSTVCAIANSMHPGSDLSVSDIAKLAP